jgi:hypothetical protein
MSFPFPMGPPPGPLGPAGPAGPPPHIPLPASGGDGPDSKKVAGLLKQAIALLDQAVPLEGDAADKAKLAKSIADLHAIVGEQQKLTDTAMGAGPGVRVLRKNAPSGGSGY